MSTKEFLNLIKRANPSLKIIYILDKLTTPKKVVLYENEVFNIIEGNSFTKEVLQENLLNENTISHNYVNKDNSKNKIISVFGTSGAGKSLISSILAKQFATQNETLLLDLDLQNSCIDLLDRKYKLLNNTVEMFSTFKNDENNLQNVNSFFEANKLENNLTYINSNISIYETQNKINKNLYSDISDYINDKFQYTIVDLTNCVYIDSVKHFLNASNQIIFVINPNYISLRQATKYMDVLNILWGIPKDKIGIVINKTTKYSLDTTIIKDVLKGNEILGTVPYIEELEKTINTGEKIGKKENIDLNNLFSKYNINCVKENRMPLFYMRNKKC
ncbi:MAG: ATP-binding cassette domain-containing protein [Clostridia bacterium]